MRKKFRCILFVLFFVLAGCESIDIHNNGDIDCESLFQHLNPETTAGSTQSFLAFITEFQNDAICTIHTITPSLFEDEYNVRVIFPKVEMPDKELQEKINILIWDEILLMLSIFPEREELTLDVDYEIKFNSNRLLSIVYTGVGFVQGAARPTHLFYTLNVNIETGEKIVFSDIVSVDDKFIELMLSDNIVHLNPDPELKQFVRGIISQETFSNRLQDAYNPMFYFTDDSLGISIGSLGGAAGDHAELEIQYELF